MEQKKATDTEQELLDLQDSLDQYTFGEETMDVDKIKEIVSRMDEILEEDTQEFRKEEVWDRICASCSEEDMKEEKSGVLYDEELSAEFGAESFGEKRMFEGVEKAAKREDRRDSGKRIFRITRKKDFYRASVLASVIVIAVFIGANIGTYATEKKSVFEVVDGWRNGTAFWVTGNVEGLDPDHEGQIFYSWNEIPNEYRKLTVVPYGLPSGLELYQIQISKMDTLNLCQIRYIDDHGKRNLEIEVVGYEGKEYAYQDLLFEETEYIFLKEEEIGNMSVKFYEDPERGYAVRFTDNIQWFRFYSTLEYETFESIVYRTIDNNF